MTVVYQQYIVIVVIAALLVSVLFFRNSIRYYRWVRKYWFYRRSLASYISLFLSIAGLLVLLVSVLDVKGKPEKQPLEIPDQKTIIMIDCSASMLVEDVKPSRFSKAILIARDFVKSAFGHQISLVLFSDYQRQIVPFTDDVNFLDTKLAALERLNITRGGSNLSQAIVEVIGYFKTDQAIKEPSGNLLIFTDAEELGEGIKVSIPENINVGVVGVGTNYGGPIPLRTKRGKFKEYKKHRGERVVSRLDEEFLKKLGKKIKSYKYWVALSYSIPTAQVVTFFHNTHEKKIQKGVIYHSKSYSREIALSGIIIIILGLLFRFFKPLIMPLSLCILILPLAANAGFDKEEMSQYFKSGVLIRNHKLKLGEVFLKEGKKNKSYVLYKELIRNPETEDNITLFNYATACLQNGKVEEGLDLFIIIKSRIGDSIADDDLAMLEKVRENIFLALNQQDKGKNKKKDKEKKEKKKDKKKQQKKQQKQEKKEKKQKKEKEDSSKSKQKKPPKSHKPKSLAAKEKQLQKQRKLQKVPQIFDQLMKEDKNVQRKQMETSKSKRRSSHDQKDW